MTTQMNGRDNELGDSPGRRHERAFVAVVLCTSFLLFAAVRCPVPGVNEPHFLSKAKHFWNPDWCEGDFFLESSAPHFVFYQTVGLLTRWLTLEQTAWIGRVLAGLLLAVGWTELMWRLMPRRWAGLWTAWVYLAVAAVGNLSGEWILGGVEAKVFSYGFVFWSLSFICSRSWNRAAVCAGLAISFHPIVGGWSLICAGFASAASGGRGWSYAKPRKGDHRGFPSVQPRPPAETKNRTAPISASWLLPAGLLIACSLPGLIPAVELIEHSSAEIAFQADYIQVYYRLAHHLDPRQFSILSYIGYGLLIAFWCIGRRRVEFSRQQLWFARFMLSTLLIAAAGLLLGLWPPPSSESLVSAWRLKLMRFYPFRLCDVMLPIAACMVLVGLAERWIDSDRVSGLRISGRQRRRFLWLLFAGTVCFSLLLPAADRNPSRMSRRQLDDWLETCRWIATQTASDALFLTPKRSWAFKWYAERAEYVTFKDCPQDAGGLVEWNRRLRYQRDWARQNYDDGYSADALCRLRQETGITYIVAERLGPFELEPIFRNRTYRVYRLHDAFRNQSNRRRSLKQEIVSERDD